MRRQDIKQGQFFSVESGIYSDYRVHGFGQALKDFDGNQQLAEFAKDRQSASLDYFLSWLVKRGLALEIEYEVVFSEFGH